MAGAGRTPSLRARALRLLAMREHSGQELRRKLAPHVEDPAQLEELLESFRCAGYLSEQRFAESLVRRRAQRHGRRLIEQELGQHGVPDEIAAPLLRGLAGDERARAQALWARRFGSPPVDLAERARQHRFLAQRGFDTETIAWVLREAAREAARANRND